MERGSDTFRDSDIGRKRIFSESNLYIKSGYSVKGSLTRNGIQKQIGKHSKLEVRSRSEYDVTGLDDTMASDLHPNRFGEGTDWQAMPYLGKSIGARRSTSSLDTITSKPFKPRKKTVTVQEYFTLTFDQLNDNHRECLPAGKGLQLKEVVAPVFSTKNLPLARFDFFVEGSASPLPLDVETLHLAGSVIIVRSRHKLASPQPNSQRDESKGVVLRQNRERKQDKRNSAGVIPLSDTANLKLPNRQRRASFSLLFPSSRLLEAEASQNRRSLPPEMFNKFTPLVWSSESDLSLSSASPRQKSSNTVHRFSQIFYSSPSKEKLDRLNEVLGTLSSNYYSTIVCEPKGGKFSCSESCDGDDCILMEKSWEDVVKEREKLTKKEAAQQSAIWELLTTEVNYMRILKSVIDVYARMLLHLQNREERFLTEIVYDRLFSNIEDIYEANTQLWHQYLSIPLKFSRETGDMLNPLLLKDAFTELPNVFTPYINFCMNADSCQRYLQHHKENNQMFGSFLQWADNQIFNELGIREGLKAHLTKPMQRLTRYKVILIRIKEETKDLVLREELQEMADVVDEYVSKVNNEVAIKQKTEKLQEIQKKLGHYDCIEPPGEEYNQFVAKYSNFKIKTPMKHNRCLREVILEGLLKMKEGQGRWTEVYCYLFTDLFLITKATKRSHPDRMKIIKPPMALDKIHPHMLNSPTVSIAVVHLSDFGCLSNIYAFTDDTQKLDLWFGKITEARKSYLLALGVDDAKDESESSLSPATRYGRTFSIQSSLSTEKETRQRSSTYGGSSPGSTPSLNTAGLDDGSQKSLSPFNPQHHSRSPLRRPANREASPLALDIRDPVSGDGKRTRLTPSSDNAFLPVSPKKRSSLGAPVPVTSVQIPSTAPVPSVSVAGHTNSLDSFQSSSGVSSVDSAHLHSGSELSSSSLVQSSSPIGFSTRATPSSMSTINGEKMAHYTQDFVSSLSNGSASDEENETRPRIMRPPIISQISVSDRRYSRSLNDLSLQSLSVSESPLARSFEAPSPLTPDSPNTCKQKRLVPPRSEIATKDNRRTTGINTGDMRIYLIEGPESEATSV